MTDSDRREVEPTSETRDEEPPRFIQAAEAMADLFRRETDAFTGDEGALIDHLAVIGRASRPIIAEAQDYDFMGMRPELADSDRRERLGQELFDRLHDPAVPQAVRDTFLTIYGSELARFAPPEPPAQQ